MNEIRITEHAYKRIRERCGWNRNTTDRMLRKVTVTGTTVLNAKGKVKPWAESQVSRKYAQESRIYGNWLYIINDNSLITVYQIPAKVRLKYTKAQSA